MAGAAGFAGFAALAGLAAFAGFAFFPLAAFAGAAAAGAASPSPPGRFSGCSMRYFSRAARWLADSLRIRLKRAIDSPDMVSRQPANTCVDIPSNSAVPTVARFMVASSLMSFLLSVSPRVAKRRGRAPHFRRFADGFRHSSTALYDKKSLKSRCFMCERPFVKS